MILKIGKYTLNNLATVNIILGKNGCGKSSLLKQLESDMYTNNENYGKVTYITPERGGFFKYDGNVDSNMVSSISYLNDTRRSNSFSNFRQQSFSQFRKLELIFLREMSENKILRNDHSYKFSKFVNKLNSLLDNIEIIFLEDSFKIFKKNSQNEIPPEHISSGEAELISLGIECLIFQKECNINKLNFLFLDEPDVHLHPDLQERLSHFLKDITENNVSKIIIATHSTAIVGALSNYEGIHIEFMKYGQIDFNFKSISDEYKKILPIFGAHPLSNIFNKVPPFLVEGEDEVRIWQQAMRTSKGKLKIYPCSTDGVHDMNQYEKDIDAIITSVYDDGIAYSLRDKDGGVDTIDDYNTIKRFKLSCRSSENLLLTNEVLTNLNVTWPDLKLKIEDWLSKNNSHPHYSDIIEFKNSNYDRKNAGLKNIRNDLLGIIGSKKSWEVVVGQAIGELMNDENKNNINNDPDDLKSYLGHKLFKFLFNQSNVKN